MHAQLSLPAWQQGLLTFAAVQQTAAARHIEGLIMLHDTVMYTLLCT
jgi:hypothetical protein